MLEKGSLQLFNMRKRGRIELSSKQLNNTKATDYLNDSNYNNNNNN